MNYRSKQFSKTITGKVYWSKITDIYYTRKEGQLYKYPAYAGAARGWTTSKYSGNETQFKVTAKRIWEKLDEKAK